MKRTLYFNACSAASIALLAFLFSCKEDEASTVFLEGRYASEESVMDAYFEDVDDLAGVVVAATDGAEGARVSTPLAVAALSDSRLCAAANTVMDDEATPALPKGTITLDFGTGCTDDAGNVRSGKIIIRFEGRRFRPESFVRITFQKYVINGLTLGGTRTLTSVTGSTLDAPKLNVKLTKGAIQWRDGTTATRTNCYVREWNRDLTELANDEMIVNPCTPVTGTNDGLTFGMNRWGIDYQIFIVEELVYKRGCPMAVAGIKLLVELSTGKEIWIDYGDGTCDAVFTVTVNGEARTIDIGR